MTAAAAPIGHNAAPDLPPVVARLTDEHADLTKRRDELLAAAARVPATIDSAALAANLTDFIKQIGAAVSKADATRKAEKEPFLEGGRQVDAFFKGVTDPLDRAKKAMTDRLTAWQRKVADEERRAREEAARKAAEEAEKKAAAAKTESDLDAAIAAEQTAHDAAAATEVKAADLSRTRGDYGAVSSLRTTWEHEVLDIREIDLEALRPHIPVGAIDQAIRGFIKAGGRELKGARIFQNTTAVVR